MNKTNFKLFTMFLAGIAFSAMTVLAATISISTNFEDGVTQYLKKLVILKNDNTTWMVLDWDTLNGENIYGTNITWTNIHWSSIYGNTLSGNNIKGTNITWSKIYGQRGLFSKYCDENESNCSSIDDLKLWSKYNENIYYTGGNVWIWTTDPTEKLVVNGTGKFSQWVCLGNDCRNTWPAVWMTGASNVAYYDQGNVGIGTDEPTEKFQVSSYAQIGDDSSSDTGWNFLRIHSTYVPGLLIQWQPLIPAYYKNPNIQLNRKSSQLQWDHKNRKIENNGTLKFDYATGSYDYDTKLSLSSAGLMTLDGTGKFDGVCLGSVCKNVWPEDGWDSVWMTGTSKIYYNSGNVGIGTWTPQAKLHVAGTIKTDKDFFMENSSNNFRFAIWEHVPWSWWIASWHSSMLLLAKDPAGGGGSYEHNWNILLNPYNWSAAYGNVGIHTAHPETTLHVAGSGLFESGLIVGDNEEYNTKISNGYLQIERECEDLWPWWDCSQRPYGIQIHNDSWSGGMDETLTIEWGSIKASKYLFLKSIIESRFTVSWNIVQTNTSSGVGIWSYFTPKASLHVKTPDWTTGRVALFEAGGSTAGQLEINWGEQSQMIIRTMKPWTDLKFATHKTGTAFYNDYQLYLKNDGNVGIWKSPSAKLDVYWWIKAIRKTADPCTTDSSNYPEGTMFYVPSHSVGLATLPDMYCFCDSSNTARPINGKLIIGTVGGEITLTSDVCFAP